ncbi:MAG TPA: hypothetical protein VFC85_03570 [Verrucomicrobiae bacterium]|nr:hypothetical protein [Verrucomicrobiae bacterium]
MLPWFAASGAITSYQITGQIGRLESSSTFLAPPIFGRFSLKFDVGGVGPNTAEFAGGSDFRADFIDEANGYTNPFWIQGTYPAPLPDGFNSFTTYEAMQIQYTAGQGLTNSLIEIFITLNAEWSATLTLFYPSDFNGSGPLDLQANGCYFYMDDSTDNDVHFIYDITNATVTPIIAISSAHQSGTNLVFSGGNGFPGSNYYVIRTTNLALDPSQWMRIGTNQFSADGTFNFTNGMAPERPRNFYRVQLP